MKHLFSHPWIYRSILALVFLLAAGWTYLSRSSAAAAFSSGLPAVPRENFPMPDFSLQTPEGQTMSVAGLRGKVVIVNFWASWCAPCRLEMPAIQKVYAAYHDQGLDVLGVNATAQDSKDNALRFASQEGVTFPVLLDQQGLIALRFSSAGLPTTYFVDRKGVIRSIVIGGPMSEALIRSKVEQLLSEKP